MTKTKYHTSKAKYSFQLGMYLTNFFLKIMYMDALISNGEGIPNKNVCKILVVEIMQISMYYFQSACFDHSVSSYICLYNTIFQLKGTSLCSWLLMA